ncbi:MAG: patatin-like phospholipase family protein [Alphaproteobacteria bacterium]|jgi:NTE family protein|nr:patatin-like phospholipase family protein [Alphaproteobacteria bacterium]
MAAKPEKVIDLALQGGGSHGAFTWGVLDRLLEDDRIGIEGVSGASAGAMNAVALADGMARGGPAGARAALERFWAATAEAARFSPIQRSPVDVMLGRWGLDTSPGYLLFDQLSRLVSPYDINLLDINPLRDLVRKAIDFDRVNDPAGLKVFLTATNVRTGRPKIFRQPQITADTVMASACLPFLFKAVEIDGEAYWDGGYMGNPALFPLVDETDARDIVIVQINPFSRPDVPKTARDIQDRLNEITFNASLLKELRSLVFLWEIIYHEKLEREAYRDARMHAIFDEDTMLALGVSSKMNAEWAFLTHLRDRGRAAADRWLAAHYDNLGVRSTMDLSWVMEESLKPAHLAEDADRTYPDHRAP